MTTASVQVARVFIVMVMPSLINEFYEFQKISNRANHQQFTEVDFILVGGGTTGAVLANRLSKKYRVLVLEKGGHPGPSVVTDVPLLGSLISGTRMDYSYETINYTNFFRAYIGQKRKFSRGKGLGGSSNINNMMYVRGHEQDFDSWAEQTKSDIWSSKNVLKYFKRSEDYHGNYPGPAHATGNELYIGKYSYESPIQKCLFDAFKEKGISTGDVNVLPSRVFGYPDVAIKNGGRWCSYQAFIKPILQRNKLIISTFSDVVKIHLSEELNKRAIGVTYRKHGTHYFVFAKKEIIISAGVIDSPKLLLLSGIGPKDHLTSLQIKPLLDLPVGETYVAQSYIPLKFQINDSLSIIPNRNLTDKTFIEYYAKRKGPLTSFNARFGIGFTQRKNSQDPNFPDIYYVFNGIGGDSSGHELFSKDSELKPGIYEKYFKSFADKDGFIVEIACVKVKSSGNIRLATKNPNDQPLINPNYFSNPTDMACSIDGIEYIVDFIESSNVMQKINAHVPTVAFPGCETLKFKSRAYWDCYIRQLTGSPDASTSSCRMGDGSKSSKTTAVIDPEFRVLGVQGLRVIDASSMPWITTGNPMATVIMMGEIGSQLILDRWEKRAKLETRISSHSIVQLQINSQVDNRNTLS